MRVASSKGPKNHLPDLDWTMLTSFFLIVQIIPVCNYFGREGSPPDVVSHAIVPMEETVRAFNFVIEQGWVRRVCIISMK
jgi:hypothetical protein